MAEARVVDLTTISHNFPEVPIQLIPRQYILDELDELFSSGIDVVILEGDDGAGKTVLAAEFARRHPQDAISLFLKADSRWGYDQAYLRHDLCSQINWIRSQEELPGDQQVDDATLGPFFTFLQRKAKHHPYYFIVDGLDEIPAQEAAQRQLVLGLLPFGLKGFKFLLSAPRTRKLETPPNIECKSFPLTGFSFEETRAYFTDFAFSAEILRELHTTCKRPGHLASVRRILHAGSKVEALLEEMPEKLPELFDIEWKSLDANSELQHFILAILAYDPGKHTIEHLGQLTKNTRERVQTCVELPFLIVDAETDQVSFVSNAFRTYAEKKLGHHRQAVQNLLIDDLMKDPQSEAAVAKLPEYLSAAGRVDDLFRYLSPEFFATALERCQSLVPLRRTAQIGVDAAVEKHRDEDLMRFAINKSLLQELDGVVASRSEVQAYMALDDYGAALATAQSVALKEDRLQLLALIARAKREKGISPEPELLDLIRQMYNQIDKAAMGERALEIAFDLMHSLPDLALELIDVSGVEQTARDLALATLTLRAYAEGRPEHAHVDEAADRIRARIQDPDIRGLSTLAPVVFGGYSAKEVIAEAEKMPEARQRINLLKQWAPLNRRRTDALQVTEYGLQLVIKTTEYTPNAGDIRKIVMPLPFTTDLQRAAQAIKTLDGLKGSLEKYGPTVEFVRVQLLIAEAEAKHGTFDSTISRAVDVYLSATAQTDLVLRAECLAHLVAFVERVDTDGLLEKKEGLRSQTEEDLMSTVNLILGQTAEHYDICRGILRALATTRLDLAKRIALSLNVEPRRNHALFTVIDAATSSQRGSLNILAVNELMDAITDPRLAELATATTLQRLSEHLASFGVTVADSLPLIDRIGGMQDAAARCWAYSQAYLLLRNDETGAYQDKAQQILDALRKALECIDVQWQRMSTAFAISAALARRSQDEGRKYLCIAQGMKLVLSLQTDDTAVAVISSVRLAIAAFGGLLRRTLELKQDITRLADLIDLIPSNGVRAWLWADVSIRYAIANRDLDARQIVATRVRPLVAGIPAGDRAYRSKVLSLIAPALYVANHIMAIEDVQHLSVCEQDEALRDIIDFILRRSPLSEPYEELPGQGYDVDYDALVKICDLLKMINSDTVMYGVIRQVGDVLCCDRRQEKYTREQRDSIATRLEQIADAKLPNKRFITHNGFRIVAQAQVYRIRDAKGVWSGLASQGEAVPNVSDRAYVLMLIAESLPNRESSLRTKLLAQARELIRSIPAANDRASRVATFAEALTEREPARCKLELKEAMHETFGIADGRDAESLQRRIIDFAHRFNPELAAALGATLDQEPARVAQREKIRRQLRVLDARGDISSGKKQDGSGLREDLPPVAWRSLASLNAHRTPLRGTRELRDHIAAAAGLPLSQSYPVLLWVIRNVADKYDDTDQVVGLIRPLFEMTVIACQVSARLASRSAHEGNRAGTAGAGLLREGSSLIIHPGERDAAVAQLRSWIVNSARNYLKICDPYFGPEDMVVLQWILELRPDLRVHILTSAEHQRASESPADTYRTYWRMKLSEADPPVTEICVVGTERGGKFPIHDRWWVTQGAGMRLGTSLNSVGITKNSEMSVMTAEEASALEGEMERFLSLGVRELRGERLLYTIFTL